MLKLKNDSPIWNPLTQNYYEYIEDISTINDEDITDIFYPTNDDILKYLYKGHKNPILSFVAYLLGAG